LTYQLTLKSSSIILIVGSLRSKKLRSQGGFFFTYFGVRKHTQKLSPIAQFILKELPKMEIRKVLFAGNSLLITLPKKYAQKMGLTPKSYLVVEMVDLNTLKITKPPRGLITPVHEEENVRA